jgi:sporulation protein YlmC with PRC-barrel domain
MKLTKLAVVALLATGSTIALAQAASTNGSTSAPALQQQMTNNLQQSGFTNVKVMPDSFLVQANDKSGNPVTMFITPNSMTEVAEIGSTTGANSAAGNGMFRSIPAHDELTSKVVGLDVYNNDNKSIGTIKDVAYNANDHVNGYILSVGGFLGIGDHYVAVRPSAVNLTWNDVSNKWHATMNASADQLKAAPEYKYAS